MVWKRFDSATPCVGFVVPCVHVVWHRHYNQGSEPELSGHVSVVSREVQDCRSDDVFYFASEYR